MCTKRRQFGTLELSDYHLDAYHQLTRTNPENKTADLHPPRVFLVRQVHLLAIGIKVSPDLHKHDLQGRQQN